MAMAGDPPAAPPTPIWHAVINNETDRRILDWDYGHSTQGHLTATQAANAGSAIVTVQGDPPDNVAIGMFLSAGGEVSAPTADTNNEQLEKRKSLVEQWILRNIPTRGFLAYQANINKRKADIYEALARRTYFTTFTPSVLANEIQWNRVNSHLQIDWAPFVRLVDAESFDPGNNYTLINSLRVGTAWRTITLDSGMYIGVSDSESHNWPPAYTYSTTHLREYEDLIASVRVL